MSPTEPASQHQLARADVFSAVHSTERAAHFLELMRKMGADQATLDAAERLFQGECKRFVRSETRCEEAGVWEFRRATD